MKIAILGYGDQGRSAYEYWHTPENVITVCDKDTSIQLPEGALHKLGSAYLEGLNEFDLIVRSPSVHPEVIVAANGQAILAKITSVTNEFFRVCPTKNIIGVTGTKGKGTTSTLIAKMLEASGKRVHLGGNIGIPPLDLLKNQITADDWVVLELANFQLIDLKYSPKIAVCLMFVPEHMDWHSDTDEYLTAKQQLFTHQSLSDIAVYYAQDESSREIASAGEGQKIPYYASPGAEVVGDHMEIDHQEICKFSDLKLLGKHNWQNACAAVTAVWQVTQDISPIKNVLTTFTGLEHRLELVRELGGVKYYDDSFATTPESAIVAIEAFKQPIVAILGGSSKNSSYVQLATTIKNSSVKKVIVIGDTGSEIAEELKKVGYTDVLVGGSTMQEMVTLARQTATNGDIILLSPGCASFGLFKNYKDRGEQFKSVVQELA